MRSEATRDKKFSEARKIIRKEPGLTKEEISSKLRDVFGSGLRHSVILDIKRDVFKRSPSLMPERNMYGRYIKAVYGSQQESRFGKLLESNLWTKHEAFSLSNVPVSRVKYFSELSQNRKSLIEQLKLQKVANGWTKAEYIAELQKAIDAEYKERGWLNKEGNSEIFRMIDDFRQALIDEGINPSPGKGRQVIRLPGGGFKFLRNKGDTRGQKVRYRALHMETIKESRLRYNQRLRARRAAHG